MNKLLLLTFLLITGCVSNSGVLPMGKDTYTLSVGASGYGSVSSNNVSSRKEALTQANQYCSSKNKETLIKNIQPNSTYAGSTYELIFQCLDANDPAFNIRPEYRKEADVVIENRK